MPPNTVYVGRPSRWGNKFTIEQSGSPAAAVEDFKYWMGLDDNTPADIRMELRGKNLCCWCPIVAHGDYMPCHADVLLSIANNIPIDEVIRENTRWAEGENAVTKPSTSPTRINVAQHAIHSLAGTRRKRIRSSIVMGSSRRVCRHCRPDDGRCKDCEYEACIWREEIASTVIRYIDTMYPAMWTNVSKSARLSIRNTILNALSGDGDRQ